MKLIDLLEVIYDWDCTVVQVHDSEGNEIACYDGKDSIPTYLNNKKISGVYPSIREEKPCIAIDLA